MRLLAGLVVLLPVVPLPEAKQYKFSTIYFLQMRKNLIITEMLSFFMRNQADLTPEVRLSEHSPKIIEIEGTEVAFLLHSAVTGSIIPTPKNFSLDVAEIY